MAQLIEGLASRVLDSLHRLQGSLWIVANDGLGGTGLDRHQAHAVRDHIMQLARDTGPLRTERAPRVVQGEMLEPAAGEPETEG